MKQGKQMGRITVILDEDVEEYVRTRNRKKGDLSKMVNAAFREQMNEGIKVGESQVTSDGNIEIPQKVRELLKISQGDTILLLGKKTKKELILRKSEE